MPARTILLSLVIIPLSATLANAFECKVCHSKNPKMVAMHRNLEGKNLFCMSQDRRKADGEIKAPGYRQPAEAPGYGD
jgi:hypothetical protein